VKEVSYELSGLGYLGVVIGFRKLRNYCRTLKNKWNILREKDRMFAILSEMPSLTFYCSVKEDRGRVKTYIVLVAAV
jgi:hypothetical protein